MNLNFWNWLKINFKVNILLIGINCLAYIFTFIFSAFIFSGNESLSLSLLGAQVLPGSEYPYSQFILQPWRFLTSSFLHGSLIHLAFNMWALYSLGNYIEKFYSGKKLFLIYIITGIGSAFASFIVPFIGLWQNNGIAQGVSISIGASGSIFGLVGVLLGHRYFKNKTYEPDLNFNASSLLTFVGINIFLGFSFNFLGSGIYVNNWAHLGGLISGLILGAFLNTVNNFEASKFKKIFEKILFILSILLFLSAIIADIIFVVINIFNL
jgi:membrane associated rhomboid family serine protease